MDICPSNAVLGPNWDVTKDRAEFFDYKQCAKMVFDENKKYKLCGKCIYICPHTQKYLK